MAEEQYVYIHSTMAGCEKEKNRIHRIDDAGFLLDELQHIGTGISRRKKNKAALFLHRKRCKSRGRKKSTFSISNHVSHFKKSLNDI
jgi:hypothetical protein